MKIPVSIPHFKIAVGIVGLYAIGWLALEGELVRDIGLAAGLLVSALLYIITKRLGGLIVPVRRAIILATAAGLLFGAGLVLLTLFLMVLKTGLHAHGPEYTAQEIAWVWRQLPLWAGAGGLAGLGLGLLAAARGRMTTDEDGQNG